MTTLPKLIPVATSPACARSRRQGSPRSPRRPPLAPRGDFPASSRKRRFHRVTRSPGAHPGGLGLLGAGAGLWWRFGKLGGRGVLQAFFLSAPALLSSVDSPFPHRDPAFDFGGVVGDASALRVKFPTLTFATAWRRQDDTKNPPRFPGAGFSQFRQRSTPLQKVSWRCQLPNKPCPQLKNLILDPGC